MYKLFVFRRLLHYVLGRAVDTCDLAAVFGSWRHLRLLCLSSQELRNAAGFLTLYSVSLPAEFVCAQNEDVLISVRSTPFTVLTSKKDLYKC
jgi:hypothetical protein